MIKFFRIFCLALICLAPAWAFAASAAAGDAEEEAEKAAAQKFAATLQDLVAQGEKREIAKLIAYPLTVDGQENIKDASSFIARYDRVITPTVRQCVLNHKPEEAGEFSSNGQYMIDWGCIWFSPAEKGGMTIDAVNTKKP